jgi:hypothetical protein
MEPPRGVFDLGVAYDRDDHTLELHPVAVETDRITALAADDHQLGRPRDR